MAKSAPTIDGFAGAFLHGSIAWTDGDAELLPGSDVDVLIVAAEPAEKLGKLAVDGVLLDVTFIDPAAVATPEVVLANYHLAGSLRGGSILLDPSGHLERIEAVVGRDFAKREWVVSRCEDARHRVLRNFAAIDERAIWHDNVTSWLFGTGVTTHILLVAGLRNPTVRTRYLAVRRMIDAYDRGGIYEELLALLGCEHMTAGQALVHLRALTEVFDEASAVARTPFFFSSDISPAARSIAIDAARDLIARGDQREAVFWLVATYARCLKILAADAPERYGRHEPGFSHVLVDLGIGGMGDLMARADVVRAALPGIWQVAMEIIGEHPAIQ